MMESSRIFVKNIPSTITEKEFRSHFSANGREITDVKVLPHRRIGYVGYKTPDVANNAVKYFNRTFIRMSRVAVELAKPIGDTSLKKTPKLKSKSLDHTDSSQPRISGPQNSEDTDNPKKRKRDELDESDPTFREYLQVMQPSSKRASGVDVEYAPVMEVPSAVEIKATESDDEYEDVPARQKAERPQAAESAPDEPITAAQVPKEPLRHDDAERAPTNPEGSQRLAPAATKDATDDEWLRSRTNRLLDLLDDDEPPPLQSPAPVPAQGDNRQEADIQMAGTEESRGPVIEASPDIAEASEPVMEPQKGEEKSEDADVEMIRKTARLFVRNLPYSTTEDDLSGHFTQYGQVEEVHLPTNGSGKSKGYAMVQYTDAGPAVEAFQASDGVPFQGRLLHIVPAAAKREQGLDEFAISQLPLKKQNIIRKKAAAASSTFNWNSLYMSQDAVNDSIANRLGVSKAELLDPTSADAAVKQAIGETTIIQETKAYFAAHGVDLNAFKSQKRGDTAILVKNFPFGTNAEELRNMFEEHGTVLQALMPPSGTIAIVQFAQPGQAKTAFAKLAYRRVGNSVLFLEKAPKDLFVNTPGTDSQAAAAEKGKPSGAQKVSATELLERDDEQGIEGPTTSLYVRNLNFSSTTEDLAEAFGPFEGFVSARVKTKLDPKKAGQVLSMGFGFVDFRTKAQAMTAAEAMDGSTLAGHILAVKASHRGLDAAEERRREDAAKKAANRGTKVIIKNLPFEVTKKDIRSLFGAYGQLRAVRVPKKFNHQSRGFAFAEFVTSREAESAVKALRDTHLLGRKLVLDYAEAETADPEEEIEKMQKKVGGQVNKVALQQLTNRGRTKVSLGGDAEDEVDV